MAPSPHGGAYDSATPRAMGALQPFLTLSNDVTLAVRAERLLPAGVTVVKSVGLQSEGLLYMVQVSTAVFDAARTARDHIGRPAPTRQSIPGLLWWRSPTRRWSITSRRPARIWGGIHYRFSTDARVDLGRSVGRYDQGHGFAGGDDCQ